MAERKTILIVDVQKTCYWFARFITRLGYEPIEAPHISVDALLEMLEQRKVDLLIIAKELTIKGPSCSDDWQEGDGMEVDFGFGGEVHQRLRLRKNNLPVILLTTDTMKKSQWMRDDHGKLDRVVMMKNSTEGHDVYEELEKAIEEILGSGLAVPEWVRVLIIDDEVEMCRNVESMFRAEGFSVDSATMADQAFQKLEQNQYDLLLVDIKMENKISGIDIIKASSQKGKRPKIIALSTIPRDELIFMFQREGIVHLVDKYFDKSSYAIPGRLISRIESVMEQYSE